MLNCSTCGRFMTIQPGAAWKMVYSGYPPEPDHEAYQCKACTEKHGAFNPQHGIKPECSCGLFK